MRTTTRLLLAVALAVTAATAASGSASAGNAPLGVAGVGTHQPPEWSLTRIQADVEGRTLSGRFTAGLRMNTTPAPGECVDAHANFAITDGSQWFSFVSLGEVCGQSVDGTSSVFAVYTGEFDLYESNRKGWTDTQGWVSFRLTTDGRASVEVYAW